MNDIGIEENKINKTELFYIDDYVTLYQGDSREVLRTLPDASVNCCVTSPPYYGLRSYMPDAVKLRDDLTPEEREYVERDLASLNVHPTMAISYRKSEIPDHLQQYFQPLEIGLEQTPDAYVDELVAVFREVRRVLRNDGTLWLNLGDSYNGYMANQYGTGLETKRQAARKYIEPGAGLRYKGLKNKDLIGIPWRVAFALQADGWYLRQDIIWCLSGGTWLYVRTQKGDMPMMVRDVYRLDPATVQLWNGSKWTQLLGINRSDRRGDELEIVLRSGERISCTPTHRFPTNRGLLTAGELMCGDILQQVRLPEPDNTRDCSIDEDAAWLAGLFVAEGSRSEDTIQISGNVKEEERWNRLKGIATKFGGSATISVNGNNQSIRIYGKILNAIIDELVTGKTAIDKGFATVVWRYSDKFISSMVDGYLSGDGHLEGNRWRLGFCRNYNLERDLRTACARLGYALTLNLSSVEYNGKMVPTFRGELRKNRSGHHNERNRNEIVDIRKSRCRQVYDLGVADDPHLFALASGVLTHNSKPNPMPESVKDRCTKAHEYIFLLSKRPRYYFDAAAIEEPAKWERWGNQTEKKKHQGTAGHLGGKTLEELPIRDKKNKRSVWTVATKPFKGAHFATFPPDLIKPCILAGCPVGGTVIDPFAGSGTTGRTAKDMQRKSILVELNESYCEIAAARILGKYGK